MNPSELSQGLGEIGVVIYVFFFKNRLFLAVLGLRFCTGFSLVAVSRGYSLVAMHRLLIVVASLVVEHKF